MFFLCKCLIFQKPKILKYKNQCFFKSERFDLTCCLVGIKKNFINLTKCSKFLETDLEFNKNWTRVHVHTKESCCTKKEKLKDENKLSADLVKWALSCKITHQTFSKLLRVLINNGLNNLPLTPKILFKEGESQIRTYSVPPGVYVHYGLINKLEQIIEILSQKNLLSDNNVDLKIFIDNLQLKKFFDHGLWIILASITGFQNTIFTVGAYKGNRNPENANLFLKKFVEEVKYLCLNGIEIKNKCYNVRVKTIICDAPAKVFILNTKNSYLGYSSCIKCNASGEYISGKVCFPEKSSPRRDEDFDNLEVYKNEKTKLLEIPKFGVVTNVPLDYMHLVCLGVVKKLMSIWSAEPCFKRETWDQVDLALPKEFQNKIKPFQAHSNWSSAQYRQFLLYYGPVVTKNVLDDSKYQHFLKLHLACRILCLADKKLYCFAEEMLNKFVEDYMDLYGREHVTHNIHGLYHLTEDCLSHGAMDNFSAFPFEKYLLQLKRLIVNKRKKVFFQAVMQTSEEKLFQKSLEKLTTNQKKLDKKLKQEKVESLEWRTYQKVKVKNWNVLGQEGDNYLLLKNKKMIRVLSVMERIKNREKSIYLKGVELLSVFNLFEKPIKSSAVGVYLVDMKEGEPNLWSIDEVDRKCLKMSMPDKKRILCSMMDEEF